MGSDFDQETAAEIYIQDKERRGRPSSHLFKLREHLVPLWPGGNPISKHTLADLASLLPLIPNDARHIYRSFRRDPSVEDDIDGFNGHVDFDIECD